jgi:hypothetical protein
MSVWDVQGQTGMGASHDLKRGTAELIVFSRGAMSPRQVLSRPSGVVRFAEGKTHASGSVAPLCFRHSRIWSRVVDDSATFRVERSLLGRSSFPR